MNIELRSDLPRLLPGAISWAEAQAAVAASSGMALDQPAADLARLVGVTHPEKVRVALVDGLPSPEDRTLQAAALQTGLLGPGRVGLTLGYSIFVCRGHLTRRLLSHELRHVHQYELHGSIAAFLSLYLSQIIDFGYERAPFEVDARTHEVCNA